MPFIFRCRCMVALFSGLATFLLVSSGHADQVPFTFANNGIRLVTNRSRSNSQTTLKLEIKAPQTESLKIIEASNPPRHIFDFHKSKLTRNRTFTLSDSKVVRSVRLGVHADFFRVVVEYRTQHLPAIRQSRVGDWFTLLINESADGTKSNELEVVRSEIEQPSETEWSATVWNKGTQDIRKDSSREITTTNTFDFRPQFKYIYSGSTQLVASGRVYSLSNLGEESDSLVEGRLYDGYLALRGEVLSLKAGKQIVTWGKSDEISPLDNVNPEDLRDGPVRRRSQRKIPILMANAEAAGTAGSVQFLYIPHFSRSRVNFTGGDWALFGPGANVGLVEEEAPKSLADNSEFGFRFKSEVGKIDYAVSYLSTRNDLPSLKTIQTPPSFSGVPANTNPKDLGSQLNAAGQILTTEFNRREILGVEFESVIDSLGIRGDLAYTRSEDFMTTSLQAVRKPTVRYVLGADYSSASDFYLNFQFNQTFIAGWDETLLLNERVQTRVLLELSQEYYDHNWKGGTRIVQGFNQQQTFFNPFVLYQGWDNYSIELGGDVLAGERNSTFGFYSQNDQLYLILQAFL